MKKIKTLFIIAIILFTLASGVTGTKIAYAGNELTSKQATQILQKINPHIVSYNVDTHEVKYDDGTSVFVTPPNGKTRNGEVTWKYFLEQKGDLRGWLKMNLSEIIAQKTKYIAEGKKSSEHTIKALPPNSASVDIEQFPQEWCTWCGPAATESALCSWETFPSQENIAKKEYRYEGVKNIPTDCNCKGPGICPNSIAYALNGYARGNWTPNDFYRVTASKDIVDINQFFHFFATDIGTYGVAFVTCGRTDYLPAWHSHLAIHYTAAYAYQTSSYGVLVSYTDSANGLYYKNCHVPHSQDGKVSYKNLPPYNTVSINAYYNYVKKTQNGAAIW